MPTIETQIHISASTFDVFRFCHDAQQRPLWDERVVSVEMLTDPPVRRGTLMRFDSSDKMHPHSWDAEYQDFQYPSGSKLTVIDTSLSSPFRTGSETWDFVSEQGGTLVKMMWTYTPRHAVDALLDSLWKKGRMRRVMQRSLANLKSLIESGQAK